VDVNTRRTGLRNHCVICGTTSFMAAAEPLTIPLTDGFCLRGEVLVPSEPRAVCVAGHAMMVDRRTLDRPPGRGLVSHLVSRGIAVVWPDLRGHGASGPSASDGADWSYDDLVADVPRLLAFARTRFPSLRLTALGHSLFAHVTLAHLGRHPDEPLDALVTLACNVANPTWRARPITRALKLAGTQLMGTLTSLAGHLPVRRLRFGSADESPGYVTDMLSGSRALSWRARDGWSYWDALPKVRTPLLAIASQGDTYYAPPADVHDLARQVPHSRTFIVGAGAGLPFSPGHMQLVLDERCRPIWDLAADFLMGDGV
jgi:predicted alpha/beta hydrolase